MRWGGGGPRSGALPQLTRRDALLAAGALPFSCLAQPPTSTTTLQQLARRSGRFFGAAVQPEQLARDPAFRAAVAAHCGVITPELALKWGAVQPTPRRLAFDAADSLAHFGRRRFLKMHGHTLLWHRSVPDWARSAIHEPNGWEVVRRWFEIAIPRFKGTTIWWDVVNEPIEPQDHAQGLRRTPFLQAFGADYIRRALESARALGGDGAKLLINEYGLEYPDAEDEARRRQLLHLVDALKRAGAPLDGIGLQAHLRLSRGNIDQEVLAAFLRELASRDLAIVITELDVREADYGLPVAQRDARVGDAVRQLLQPVLDEPAVRGVITWGLSDRYSWMNHEGESGFGVRGGNRGLPLDAQLAPKPFFDALAETLRYARPAVAA